MKKASKLFALILVIAMIASLAACSNNQAAPDGNTANADTSSTAEAAEAADNKLDLATTEFEKTGCFSDGLAWVDYLGSSTVIDKEGNILYQTNFKVYDDCAPFQDGVSWVKDQNDYSIIDKDGNVLYQTKPYSKDDSEKILAYGDGKFLVCRHKTGFDQDSYMMGTIDKDGNETSTFAEFDDDHKDFAKNNWVYAGNGCFVPEQVQDLVYDTADGKLRCFQKDFGIFATNGGDTLRNAKAANGRMWIAHDFDLDKRIYHLDVIDLHSGELITDFSFTSLEEFAKVRVNGTTAVIDGEYYDLNGEKIAAVSLYQDKVLERGEFSEAGYAYLLLKDSNNDTYITYVNKDGEQQFEPMKVTTGKYDVESCSCGDTFALSDVANNAAVIYDHTGTEKYRIDNVKNANIYPVEFLGDGYAIVDGKYYFFQ